MTALPRKRHGLTTVDDECKNGRDSEW